MYSSQFGPRGFEIFLLALNLIKTSVPNYTKKGHSSVPGLYHAHGYRNEIMYSHAAVRILRRYELT